jgi:hypothetical protein
VAKMKKNIFFILFLYATVFVSSIFGFGIFSIFVYTEWHPVLSILGGLVESALCQSLFMYYWGKYIEYDSEFE